MDSPITLIVAELKGQLEPLTKQETELKEDLAVLKTQRQKIEAALKALEGVPKKNNSSKRHPMKRCSTKTEVLQIMVELLSDNGSLEKEDLQELIKNRLMEEGRNLSGFVLRFKEALKETGIRISEEGTVSLIQ